MNFPPDELEKEQCAQGEEQADAGDKHQHDPRGADGRVNACKIHTKFSFRGYRFRRSREKYTDFDFKQYILTGV